jgi:hypothetical protein
MKLLIVTDCIDSYFCRIQETRREEKKDFLKIDVTTSVLVYE